MAGGERTIWCVEGQLEVALPEEAYDVDWLSDGIEITPCLGCKHSGHLKKITQIKSEVEDLKKVNAQSEPHLTHKVQVFEYKNKLHVQCTCECYPETVKEE